MISRHMIQPYSGIAALVLGMALLAAPVHAADDESFRTQAPTPAAPRSVQTPKPEIFKLANGIEVVLVERHTLPTVSLELELTGGSAWDPPQQSGLASVCMTLLTQGTAALDKLQLSEKLADLAASLDSSAGTDMQRVQLAVLSRNFAPALDLLADSLLRPAMRADELDRLVARRKAAITQAKGNPAAVQARVLNAVAFGPDHPLGRVATEASLATVTPAQCLAHAKALSPVGARLYVVGDVTRAQIEAEVGRRLADWKTPAPKLVPLGKPAPRNGKLFVVAVPGAEQSVVAVLHQGPPRKARDYEATSLLTSVLSNGFSSRINMNLREAHGWAYGAGGGFGYRRDGSLLQIQASVRTDATGPSIVEIFGEITRITAEAVKPEELDRDKEGAILSLPARWSTGASIASTFQGLRYFGLPLDWYDGYVARVQAVDAKAVLAAAKAHLKPAEAQVLIVGDPQKIQAQLQALTAAGPLRGAQPIAVDADGRVVP